MVIGLLLVVVAPGAAVFAQTDANDAAVQRAVEYMRTQQADDGTFAGFGASSTADAIYALVAADVNPAEFKSGQASAVDGLAKLAPEAAKETGVAAKFVLAALLAGQNPRALGGMDLVAVVEQGRNASNGRYGADVSSHALSLLALQAAGAPPPADSVVALERLQLPDGGWSFDGTVNTGSDTNTTSLALQALQATGGTDETKQQAIQYLRTQQNVDGGFPFSQTSQFGNASDANSTSLALQAILASGDTLNNWVREGRTPLDRLLAFQNESGAFRFQEAQAEDNQLATYQAVPAVEGETLPLEGLLIAQPAQATTTAGPGATTTATITSTATITTTTPLTGALPITSTAAITSTGVPTATVGVVPTASASDPIRLPDTGGASLPLFAALLFALAVIGAGLAVRRGNA